MECSPSPRSSPARGDILLVFFVTFPYAAGIEDLERFASGLPAVREVEALVFVRTHSFTDWFDDLLAQAAMAMPSSGRANADVWSERAGSSRLARPTGSLRPRPADGVAATQ